MRLTENKLLRSYHYWTNGGMAVSECLDGRVYWTYRTADGCVCGANKASYITTETMEGQRREVSLARRLTRHECERQIQMEHDFSRLFPAD